MSPDIPSPDIPQSEKLILDPLFFSPKNAGTGKDKPEWWPHVMSSITLKDMDLYMNQMDSAAACGMIQMVNGYIPSVAIGNKTNC